MNFKLQSAMEYLMTYGWAILIIAIVMVALFSLGILGGSPLGTSCLPQSGFECTGVALSHTTGNVIVTVGQNTGTNWATANVYFVPQGTGLTSGVPTSISNAPASGNYLSSGLTSGQTAQVTVPVAAPSISVGATYAGALWAVYTTSTGGSTLYYAELATITMKAS